MKLLIANLENNLSKEAETVKIESNKNSQLRNNIDSERELVQSLKHEVMTIQEKLKQEQLRSKDEEYHKETFEKALQEEKLNIENFKKKIVEGQHQMNEENTAMKDRIRDMELDIQQLSKQVSEHYLVIPCFQSFIFPENDAGGKNSEEQAEDE